MLYNFYQKMNIWFLFYSSRVFSRILFNIQDIFKIRKFSYAITLTIYFFNSCVIQSKVYIILINISTHNVIYVIRFTSLKYMITYFDTNVCGSPSAGTCHALYNTCYSYNSFKSLLFSVWCFSVWWRIKDKISSPLFIP